MKAVTAFLLVLCHLAISHAWNCGGAPRLSNIRQIDAGQGQVVATTNHNYAYFLVGPYWQYLRTNKIKHITVGPAGLWAVDTSNKVNKYVAGKFLPATGLAMQQVDAGGDVNIAGVSPSKKPYCLTTFRTLSYRGRSSPSWTTFSGSLKYFSCGPLFGCWGTNSHNQVYMTKKITTTNCGMSGWLHVSGLAVKVIEVGTDGSVFAVTTTGKVYQRVGITGSRPQGSGWRLVPMCMAIKHVSYDLGTLWVVTTSGLTMRCTH
ncbi:fish-egg lectin-like [Scomber japonicus]|uniref:fish-egg lectin-like n=1 Tax=Scomber japonicus TaxID=13676 RepID=UPI0023051972|nr:fish-egg lectin-like [Scomber japonicus]